MPIFPAILFFILITLQGCGNDNVEKKSKEEELVEAYVLKYRQVAEIERIKNGIPFSIKLAQGILESKCGRSELALKANNHFGIKCGKNWNGEKYNLLSDEWNKKKNKMISKKGCFRVYPDAETCYKSHSEVLKQKRYKALFKLDKRDYKNWALGIQKLGYATDPEYAQKLISIIDRYKLYELDNEQ